MKQLTVFQFLAKFPDEATCEKYILNARWPKGIFCPHCGNHNVYRLETQKRFKCGNPECYKQFTVRTGSVLAESKVPLQKWLMAMWLLTTNTKGMSSVRLAKTLGVTQKTAWFLAHRIREAYAEGKGGLLTGEVEIDETYMGGKEKNKHADKKTKNSQGGANKIAVMGLKQRDGKIKAMPVADTTKKTLQRNIKKLVSKDATIYTDEHRAYYDLLDKGYNHAVVNHSVGEYVNGMASTNGIESFWALLKRGFYGIYHQMSPAHLSRYVNEFSFRHNVNNLNCEQALSNLLYRTNGKRLTYDDLKTC